MYTALQSGRAAWALAEMADGAPPRKLTSDTVSCGPVEGWSCYRVGARVIWEVGCRRYRGLRCAVSNQTSLYDTLFHALTPRVASLTVTRFLGHTSPLYTHPPRRKSVLLAHHGDVILVGQKVDCSGGRRATALIAVVEESTLPAVSAFATREEFWVLAGSRAVIQHP